MFGLFRRNRSEPPGPTMELTLAEIAVRLRDAFGWRSCKANPEIGIISYISRRGRPFVLNLEGEAHEFFRGEPLPRKDKDESICIRDALGLKRLKWRHDKAGNFVAVC